MTKEEILNILREAGGYVSGEFLAEKLGVSRAAVWKHIHALIKDGYAVDVAQGKGYMLVSVPDKLYPAEIRHGLQTRLLGRKVVHLNVTGSTNAVARQIAERGVEEGTVVLAETQSHGKGRLGRRWVATPGALPCPSSSSRPSDPLRVEHHAHGRGVGYQGPQGCWA